MLNLKDIVNTKNTIIKEAGLFSMLVKKTKQPTNFFKKPNFKKPQNTLYDQQATLNRHTLRNNGIMPDSIKPSAIRRRCKNLVRPDKVKDCVNYHLNAFLSSNRYKKLQENINKGNTMNLRDIASGGFYKTAGLKLPTEVREIIRKNPHLEDDIINAYKHGQSSRANEALDYKNELEQAKASLTKYRVGTGIIAGGALAYGGKKVKDKYDEWKARREAQQMFGDRVASEYNSYNEDVFLDKIAGDISEVLNPNQFYNADELEKMAYDLAYEFVKEAGIFGAIKSGFSRLTSRLKSNPSNIGKQAPGNINKPINTQKPGFDNVAVQRKANHQMLQNEYGVNTASYSKIKKHFMSKGIPHDQAHRKALEMTRNIENHLKNKGYNNELASFNKSTYGTPGNINTSTVAPKQPVRQPAQNNSSISNTSRPSKPNPVLNNRLQEHKIEGNTYYTMEQNGRTFYRRDGDFGMEEIPQGFSIHDIAKNRRKKILNANGQPARYQNPNDSYGGSYYW